MTDKAERRKFLKTALAALATTAGATSCNRRTEPAIVLCYDMAIPIEPIPDPESADDPENQTPHEGEEQP